MKHLPTIVLIALLALPLACQNSPERQPVEIGHYPLDNTQGLLMPDAVSFVTTETSDGNGALEIEAKLPMTIELLEVEPEPVEEAILIYQAQLKSRDLKGTAYLELWCDFGAKGQYVARGQDDAVSGETFWKTVQTHYALPPGKRLERVKLNLVINGQGTVWIDDLHLLKSEQ